MKYKDIRLVPWNRSNFELYDWENNESCLTYTARHCFEVYFNATQKFTEYL
jgi:hypothetical protein